MSERKTPKKVTEADIENFVSMRDEFKMEFKEIAKFTGFEETTVRKHYRAIKNPNVVNKVAEPAKACDNAEIVAKLDELSAELSKQTGILVNLLELWKNA